MLLYAHLTTFKHYFSFANEETDRTSKLNIQTLFKMFCQ